jgi:hypothetical protein
LQGNTLGGTPLGTWLARHGAYRATKIGGNDELSGSPTTMKALDAGGNMAAAALDERTLSNLTLSSWAATVWEKELRGLPLQKQEASLAWCMRQHEEWRNFWNSLNHPRSADAPRSTSMLVHIYNDAAVKLQLDTKNPPEILELFQTMQRKVSQKWMQCTRSLS